MPSGVTADTPTNLVVGAGLVYCDHAIFGASVDNNVFRIERELFTPELNGVKGVLLGTDYIKKSNGVVETTIPEVSAAVLAKGWPGSRSSGTSTVVIDEDDTRRVPTSDYHDWKLQVERLNGGAFDFEVDNAINRGNIEGELRDDGLFAPRYTLTAAWDPADTTVSPHRIRVLDVATS